MQDVLDLRRDIQDQIHTVLTMTTKPSPLPTTRRSATGAPLVLLVEDEDTLADIIADNLEEEGYQVEVARDGKQGLEAWTALNPSLIVLDVMLPHINGFDVCNTMRERGDTTPVLFLSAKGQAEDRVTGLSVGGDDYLTKPFHLPEFLLRVGNMLKRQQWGQGSNVPSAVETISFGGNNVNFRTWVATLASGRQELLGERELKIFKLLAMRSGEVVSRDDILDDVWGEDAFPSSRTVDNFVLRLRKLFEPNPSEPVYIHTIWGVGYKFTPDGPDGDT